MEQSSGEWWAFFGLLLNNICLLLPSHSTGKLKIEQSAGKLKMEQSASM